MMPGPSSSRSRANQACHACRRLKRRCTREVPSCLLCSRLGKSCEYPLQEDVTDPVSASLQERLRTLERLVDGSQGDLPVPGDSEFGAHSSLSLSSANIQPDTPIPTSFFLDLDLFAPIQHASLAFTSQPHLRAITSLLGPDRVSICERYLRTTHRWLPFMSRKRVLRDLQQSQHDHSASTDLVLLCMKLFVDQQGDEVRSSPVTRQSYLLARSSCFDAEVGGFISLRLVQSLLLLALYEYSHAVFPAAYLTLGRAARVGHLIGLHDRMRAKQLFVDAETWTQREEERRTWWAMFVLDRIANSEARGFPFAVTEPSLEQLLPTNETDWDEGRIGSNESLLTTSFHSEAGLGCFARTCQAAHMLGKTIIHVHGRDSQPADGRIQYLQEATHLHKALTALHATLQAQNFLSAAPLDVDIGPGEALALATGCTARFLLYDRYGCNERPRGQLDECMALETELQQVALQGIEQFAFSVGPRLAAIINMEGVDGALRLSCPLLCGFVYYIGTVCVWFIKEDHRPETYESLREVVAALKTMGQEWTIANEYHALLEKAGAMTLLEEYHSISVQMVTGVD